MQMTNNKEGHERYSGLYGVVTTRILDYASQDIVSPNQLNGLDSSLFIALNYCVMQFNDNIYSKILFLFLLIYIYIFARVCSSSL